MKEALAERDQEIDYYRRNTTGQQPLLAEENVMDEYDDVGYDEEEEGEHFLDDH